MRLRLTALPVCLVAALAACSTPSAAPPLRHLERPGDVAFACVGSFLGSGSGAFTGALPPIACPLGGTLPPTGGADAGVAPDGGAADFTQLAFVLEPVRGALSVARLPNGGFVDSDRFAPGLNGVAVGRLPVAVTTSTEGCYAVTANAGSCDLAKVDVVKAVGSRSDTVSFVSVKAGGRRILSRPTNVVARVGLPTASASDCSAPSEVYVSFESCHLVARVDLASGDILDGILSPPGEAPRVVGPEEVTCPVECSAAEIEETARPQEAVDAGADEPVDAGATPVDAPLAIDAAPLPALGTEPSALGIEIDGVRLYAGGPETSGLMIADLDAAGQVTALSAVQLEGGVGVKKLAPSGPLVMGNAETGEQRRFVYAVATDSTVRVIDVTPGRTAVECDTQIDRRFLHDERNVPLMACFPVGRKENPPRRADARGPGIQLPRGVLPLDVAFIRPAAETTQPDPAALNGVFAYITAVGPVADSRAGRGTVYVVNVDDDNYPDSESGAVSYRTDIALALPHSLRDRTTGRNLTGVAPNTCTENAPSGSAPVRVDPDIIRPGGFPYSDTGVDGDPLAPGLRRTLCPGSTTAARYELQASADPAIRAQLIGDLEKIAPRSVADGTSSNDSIVVVWEGPMSFDTTSAQRRGGKLSARSSTELDLAAPGGALCSLGGEVGDIVQLLGCTADADCAYDEVCVIHPDTPSGESGLCAPRDREIDYVAQCRSLLVSARRYTAVELYQDRAVITPRPDVLPATPIEGCDDSEQCATVEDTVLRRVEAAQGVEVGSTFTRHSFSCERDLAMGGPRRCIFACTTDDQCNSGAICNAGRCMLAPVPPPECVSGLQRYELRGGDSLMVLSSLGTFRHRQMVEPGTGRCVENTALSPLIQNRIRRIEPPCTDLSVESIDPNPCQIPDLTEPVLVDGAFTATRPSYGMRIRSPGISFDVVDVAARLDGLPDLLVSNIPADFGFRIEILGGFSPFTFTLGAALPERAKTSPDGAIWVVDSGDSGNGFTRGQVFRMNSTGVDDNFSNRLR